LNAGLVMSNAAGSFMSTSSLLRRLQRHSKLSLKIHGLPRNLTETRLPAWTSLQMVIGSRLRAWLLLEPKHKCGRL